MDELAKAQEDAAFLKRLVYYKDQEFEQLRNQVYKLEQEKTALCEILSKAQRELEKITKENGAMLQLLKNGGGAAPR